MIRMYFDLDTCPDPSPPINGKMELKKKPNWYIANYSCDPGFKMVGRYALQFCVPEPANKNWIPDKPKCMKGN